MPTDALPPDIQRELDAIDAALGGRPVEPELTELGALAVALREEMPFVTMRQQQHNAIHSLPFSFGRRNELVNDDLRTIHKISKLCLPQNKRIRVCQSITIFKSQYTKLTQQGIINSELGLSFFKMI